MGLGGTYHFWGSTNGIVLTLTVSWHDSRYEVGVFRMSTPQMLTRRDLPAQKVLAEPYPLRRKIAAGADAEAWMAEAG